MIPGLRGGPAPLDDNAASPVDPRGAEAMGPYLDPAQLDG
jgi:hypothetical protein